MFNKIITFFKEVYLEIKKINWPGKDETLKYTFVVISASVIVALFLGGLDYIFMKLLKQFIL